ncbi:hypothetical protein OBBRIDRAFT_738197 [Obba rivulosa]|uniref:Uncharacterized protein n=1 Tax=Obba rivulosa TaxID=1052685 RepID=A0A8E2DL05_9APHY|nr:hypothetical protein OBBRIDRAFT_738197 [Obba rivulosa]
MTFVHRSPEYDGCLTRLRSICTPISFSHPRTCHLLTPAPQNELVPSLAHVQASCVTALTDILLSSGAPQAWPWHPSAPDRRHSSPVPAPAAVSAALSAPAPPSPLQSLVFHLRTQQEHSRGPSMAQRVSPNLLSNVLPTYTQASDELALISELTAHIDRLTTCGMLSLPDAALARSLSSLVADAHRLADLHPSVPPGRTQARVSSWSGSPPDALGDPFVRLRRHLSDLRLERAASAEGDTSRAENALLWARIDTELERVAALCQARIDADTHTLVDADVASLPPEYDAGGYDPFLAPAELDGLPAYPDEKNAPARESVALDGVRDEKMRMDLEAVTRAIDRLYLVAPQLHDQRVELKDAKRAQMERARRAGKQREAAGEETRELERMVELIGKAAGRTMLDQTVVLEGGLDKQMERARLRDLEKREKFVQHLMEHSSAGRLHSQDASHSASTSTLSVSSQLKDPEALLSLPEFIREAVPDAVQLKMQLADPRALLSLPDFVREPVPETLARPAPPAVRRKSFKGMRSRSMSAPPLAWLLTTGSRPSSPGADAHRPRSAKSRRTGSSSGITPPPQSELEVQYVAEYHENLHHVMVFLTVSGMTPGVNLEAEVVPPLRTPDGDGDGACLLLKCGAGLSPLLRLPARVAPGKKDVKVAGPFFEIKLAAAPPASAASTSTAEVCAPALLDAAQLAAARPTGFVCASCSLPLVQAGRLREWRDLPSEHWAELVEAWMCHADQKLNEQVRRHSNEGFWPAEGQALVGGSYILVDEAVMVSSNLGYVTRDVDRTVKWRRVLCICGAAVGRCQKRRPQGKSENTVYRLSKYAVRHVSPNAEPLKIPLSAFIAEDMQEFVQAHATYRFIIFDEEEERPRILIWLFKPSMRIAYATPTQYVIPKSGAIHAAKVLFKVLGPATSYSDVQEIADRYPGFPQAEHLFYPIDICRRLAGVLKESNTAYPESMRTMTGLDVGWLQRI